MDSADIDRIQGVLRSSNVFLVQNIELHKEICDYLYAKGKISKSMIEIVDAEKTRQDKSRTLLRFISPRTDAYKEFIDALISTKQNHIVSRFYPQQTFQQQTLINDPSSNIFINLENAIIRLKPRETESERSGKVSITSVNIFAEESSKSSLGPNEIKFLLASKVGLFGSEDSILSWDGAPSKNEFNNQMARYNCELNELNRLISYLQYGGIEMEADLSNKHLLLLLSKIVTHNTNRWKDLDITIEVSQTRQNSVYIAIDNFEPRNLSKLETDIITSIIHTILCFTDGGFSFIIRKTQPPLPNSYLIYNASELAKRSRIILNRDKKWIVDTAQNDESVFFTKTVSSCPWL